METEVLAPPTEEDEIPRVVFSPEVTALIDAAALEVDLKRHLANAAPVYVCVRGSGHHYCGHIFHHGRPGVCPRCGHDHS